MTEGFISVDVETSGPNPGSYSLLSIGACLVIDPATTFYAELQPLSSAHVPEALAVSGLSLERLASEGLPPEVAMRSFEEWVRASVPANVRPVFVALNAPFDWMFVADYFHRFLGSNPFGHSALDVKALFMGATGTPWSQSTYHTMADRYEIAGPLPHHAREDAVVQAAVVRQLLAEIGPNNER